MIPIKDSWDCQLIRAQLSVGCPHLMESPVRVVFDSSVIRTDDTTFEQPEFPETVFATPAFPPVGWLGIVRAKGDSNRASRAHAGANSARGMSNCQV